MENVQVSLYSVPNYYLKQYLNGAHVLKMDEETFWNMFAVKVEYNEPNEEKSVVYEFDKFGMPLKWIIEIKNGTRNSWLGNIDNILKIYDYFPIGNLKQGVQAQFKSLYEVREKLREWESEMVHEKYK